MTVADTDLRRPRVSIIDFGMGNLFSVEQACWSAGLEPQRTSRKSDLLDSEAIILPGVGAFGRAMEILSDLDLITTIKDLITAGRPFLGICLGMQLLFERSMEFGEHSGLGVLKGQVLQLEAQIESTGRRIKVPEVGWNSVRKPQNMTWDKTLFRSIDDGAYFYFSHSYHVVPDDDDIAIGHARFGKIHYCAAVQKNLLYACQFHPERSGSEGLNIYKNFRDIIVGKLNEK